MLGKYRERKVDDIDGRVQLLTKIIMEMADERKNLSKITTELHAGIMDMSTRFTCIAHACSLKADEEEGDYDFFTPKKE